MKSREEEILLAGGKNGSVPTILLSKFQVL